MQLDTQQQLSKTTIALHWVVGLSIIGLLAVGQIMESFEIYSLYPIHKAFGFLLFFVIMARVLWRLKNGWPVPLSQREQREQLLIKAMHWFLIIGTVLMPVSGFLMSALGGHGVDVFGLEIVARNPDPSNPQEVIALNPAIAGLGHEIHEILGKLMMLAVVLHIAGAIKHHRSNDGSLRRMKGARID